MYEARIERDSITQYGERLITVVCTFPRIILAEKNTHRMLSKSSASSRAIPVRTQIDRLRADPFYPVYWGKNQKGMQADEELSPTQIDMALSIWNEAREANIGFAERLLEVGVHKQITNRRLECDMWHTAIVSGTEWSNWEHLRISKHAQPEIKKLAEMVLEVKNASKPQLLREGEWHLPFTQPEDFEFQPENEEGDRLKLLPSQLVRVSVGRSARVSYLTHDGKRAIEEDIRLADTCLQNGHMAPWEHAARPMTYDERQLFGRPRWFAKPNSDPFGSYWGWVVGETEYFLGNFNGWVQARKLIYGERDVMAFER